MTGQEVEAIIEEEKLGSDSATEEHEDAKDSSQDSTQDDNDQQTDDSSQDDTKEDTEDKSEKSEETTSTSETTEDVEEDETDVSQQVAEAKTFIGQLNLSEDQVFDNKGNAKDFKEVVPFGQFALSQMNPVKVTDKDGKTHEFMLITDVEKKFPDGFEAKNNIEQLKFERGIMANENKFESAVKTYNDAESMYNQEMNTLVGSRNQNMNIGKEYVAMANAGLVPKVEGDVSDPNNKAAQSLDELMEYMTAKNAELAKSGLGQINSLWVAKQLMDSEGKQVEKDTKKQNIDEQRKKVASLSGNPTATNDAKDTKKPDYTHLTSAQYIEQVIAEEGLK